MSSPQVEDVWIDMLELYQQRVQEKTHEKCTVADLGIEPFVRHAVDMMKHFHELFTESLAMPGITIDILLSFSDLLFDEHLFRTLVENLLLLPKKDRQQQSGVFFLIFEVCEWKVRFYRMWSSQIAECKLNLPDAPIFQHIQSKMDHVTRLSQKYQATLCRDFASSHKTIELCREAMKGWHTLSDNLRSE